LASGTILAEGDGMLSKSQRLLVVDDDEDWVDAITEFLQEEGYHVTSAPNGSVALEVLSRGEPMVLLTDIRMPVMDGRELLAKVLQQYARVPVIVVSGEHAEIDDPGLAGAFRVIPKPVPVEQLLSAIGEAVRQSVPSAPQVRPRSPGSRPSYRLDRLRRRLVESLRSAAPATQAIFLTLAVVTSVAFLNYWRTRLS
jgi:CheY-like chemotaxis protein